MSERDVNGNSGDRDGEMSRSGSTDGTASTTGNANHIARDMLAEGSQQGSQYASETGSSPVSPIPPAEAARRLCKATRPRDNC